MNDIEIVYNNKIYSSYYDLLVQKITDDTSRKHYIALKNDCIIFVEEDGKLFDERNKNVIISLQVFKAKETYKIDKRVHGIYIFPSSDYKFYFLDREKPIESREKGLKFLTNIIFLRFYEWNMIYGNKIIDILPNLFTSIEISKYVIKPNTVLTLKNSGEIDFIENINLNNIDNKFKSSIF
ncbi:MAG: hypothetical protein ACFE9I_03345 [Candidatus Hermodarchaeota archaeon]